MMSRQCVSGLVEGEGYYHLSATIALGSTPHVVCMSVVLGLLVYVIYPTLSTGCSPAPKPAPRTTKASLPKPEPPHACHAPEPGALFCSALPPHPTPPLRPAPRALPAGKFGAYWVQDGKVVGAFIENATPEDANALKAAVLKLAPVTGSEADLAAAGLDFAKLHL